MNPILIAQLDDAAPAGSGLRARRASTFLQADIRFDGKPPAKLRVRNLSAGGMMVDSSSPPLVGTPVEARLRGIGVVTGRIVWARTDRVGVAFDTTVDPGLARKPEQRSVDPDRLVKPTSALSRRAPLLVK